MTGVELSQHDAVVPDLVFIAKDQREIITPRYVEGAPAVIVEVVEDDTRDMDERIKRALYERVGVHEYWLVDRDAGSLKILRRDDGRFVDVEVKDELTSPLLPGFALTLDKVFAE